MSDIITTLQDMRYLDWGARKMSPGTPGCFLKAYEEMNGKKIYYKLSNYDSYRGVFGHECVNEIIVSRLMELLGIPHLKYTLIHALLQINGENVETWITASENFRLETEEKMAFDSYYDLQKIEKESPLEFAVRNGWGRYFYQMMVIDYLVANRDRHGSNLEVLIDMHSGKAKMAPLFDQGVSLLFSTYGNEKQIEDAEVMKDFATNNYIGSKSLEYNLTLIPKDYDLHMNDLKTSDKKIIFKDIEKILTDRHIDKLWEMIWNRWCYYDNLRNQTK